MDKKEMELALADLKSKLEESFDAKMKKEIEAQIKALETQLKAAEGLQKSIDETGDKIAKVTETLEGQQKSIDKLLVTISEGSIQGARKDTKSFNEYLAEAITEAADQIKAHNKKGAPELKIEMKAVGDMSIPANFPGSTPWTQNVSNQLIETPYNRVWLADLLPGGTATGASIIYPKENGMEGGAAVWDPTANVDKAQIDYDLTSQTAFFKWIAGFVIVEREMLDDIPWLLSYLQNKMLISLKTAENNFVLNGTTDTNPVQGMLDVATAYSGSFSNPVDRLVDAGWGQIVEDTFDFYNPTNFLIRPRDSVKIGLNKATGSGEYDLPAGSVSFAAGKLNVAGITGVPTTSMTEGESLVFDRNAMVFVRRMQPELRMFEDSALAKRNKVMFRIEERATLAIFNNSAIVNVPLDFA